ncbi:MAG: thiol-disulfide isomerase/thioredoxin [Patiriisocius sp.]|jgi:thiol-disulfide isomerase/thioredoxin
MKKKNLFLIGSVFLSVLVFVSCSKTEENVPLSQETVEIAFQNFVRPASLRNQEIPFTVLTEDGVDVTAASQIFVNGAAINGTVFISSEIGDFEAYATYEINGNQITTPSEPFKVIIPKRKVVLEDYTGTWCGFCPSVAAAIEEASLESDDLAIVAIHITANSNPDPMHFDAVDILRDVFEIDGLPQARIDRSEFWFAPYFVSDAIENAGVSTTSSVSINSTLEDDQLITQVHVISETGINSGDKLVVYLLEDGILYDQENYYNEDTTSPYFGLGNPIPNFEHNHTLRMSFSAVLGDDIAGAGALEEYSITYNNTIPANYVKENLTLIAMYVSQDNLAYNAQVGPINMEIPYQ